MFASPAPACGVETGCAAAGVDDLDTAALADEVMALGARQRSLGARRLVLAVTWADRHLPDCQQGPPPEGADPTCGCQEPRTASVWERRVRVCRWPGHDGTPAVSASGIAELAVLCGTTTLSGSLLLGDALDLRHRLPRLWARLLAGEVEDWQARRVARLCAVLDRDRARAVDAAVAGLVGDLAWSRVLEAVEGEIVRVDPEGHAERRQEAESRAYVSAGRYRGTNAAGMRTLVAQLPVAQVARMDAMVQHLADLLAAAGDTAGNDLRRAKALVLLVATPGQAVLLLGGLVHPDHAAPQRSDDSAGGAPDDEPAPEPEPCPDEGEDEDEDEDGDAPLTAPQLAAVVGRALGEHAATHGVRDLWGRLSPPTSVVLHLSEDALRASAADRPGEAAVARMADGASPLGPLDTEQVCEVLTEDLPDLLLAFLAGRPSGTDGPGPAARLWDRITLAPVVDTTGQVPVDAYELPPAMRAALDHSRGVETFPWGTLDARAAQADHTRPFDHGGHRDRARAPGGRRPPPGQTRMDNLGPLSVGHHNLKTHHGWVCRQPLPGLYLWRVPSGHWFQVDHTGTRPLGRDEPAILRHLRDGPDDPATHHCSGAVRPPTAPEITDAELDHLVAVADPPDLAA